MWPLLEFNCDDWYLDPEGMFPPLRLPELLAVDAARAGHTTLRWALAAGAEVIAPPGCPTPQIRHLPSSREPAEALQALTRLLRGTDVPVTVIIDHVESAAPAAPLPLSSPHQVGVEVLHGWGLDPAIRKAGNRVVLIARQDAPHELLSRGTCGYRSVRIPLPDLPLRREFLARLCVGDESLEDLASTSGGLRGDDLLQAARDRKAQGVPLRAEDLAERKRAVIRVLAGDLLEVHQPRMRLADVAGLDHAKRYVAGIDRAGSLPGGLLLAGPSGSGKSLLAETIASELGFALVSLRSIREQWVGASERNLERALWVISSLAPVVVRVDEVDQVAGQREEGPSGDSGTNRRITSRIWEFMSDVVDRHQVLFIGTTNRPDLIDDALRDRFAARLALLHPTPPELAQLFPALARQIGVEVDTDPDDLLALCRHPALEMTTARAVREILLRARQRSSQATLDTADLAVVLDDYRPNTDRGKQERLALHALNLVRFASDLPWSCAQRPPDYLLPLLNADGTLNPELLSIRLADLDR